jgi:hypothetical protein
VMDFVSLTALLAIVIILLHWEILLSLQLTVRKLRATIKGRRAKYRTEYRIGKCINVLLMSF